MEAYLGKDWHVPLDMMNHATVKQVTRRVKGCGHNLYTNSSNSSPDLYNNLTEHKINCCGTVRPNQFTETGSDIRVTISGDMRVMVWKDKLDVHMLTHIHYPLAEGNFFDDSINALKPAVVQDYRHYMGDIDRSDRMANSYSISCHMWKWTKKLFLHLLNLTILISHILLKYYGSKLSVETSN
jgi:hypothetical protein